MSASKPPRFRCHKCGATFTAWAPAERHGNEIGHGRIEWIGPAGVPPVRRRPQDGPRRRLWLNVCVSEELMTEIDEAAERAGLAKGAWVRELIEDTLGLVHEDDVEQVS